MSPADGYPGHIRDLIETLIAHSGGTVTSVFIPTEPGGPEVEQNRIRLRNRLAHAGDMLETMGWKPRQREEYLAQAGEKLEGEAFWKRGGLGLAVFIDPDGGSRDVFLEHPVPERTVVADTYHVRPLLPGMSPLRVRVLVLTLGRVRLYEMTRHQLSRVEDVDLPESFDDVNWFVDREKQGQQHADARGHKGIRHGHDPSERRQADVERFLAAIDDALPPEPGGPPLAVLGVESLVERFVTIRGPAEVYPVHSGVNDADDPNQVRKRAQTVLDRLEEERREVVVERALTELGQGNGSVALRSGLQAAVSGRVAELVLSSEAAPVWGGFDVDTLEMTREDTQSPGDVDLVDRLAVHSMRHGAEITVVDSLIGDHDWVAIARF